LIYKIFQISISAIKIVVSVFIREQSSSSLSFQPSIENRYSRIRIISSTRTHSRVSCKSRVKRCGGAFFTGSDENPRTDLFAARLIAKNDNNIPRVSRRDDNSSVGGVPVVVRVALNRMSDSLIASFLVSGPRSALMH